MTDPFRDELESAHARTAQLESENARLRGELEAARSQLPVHKTMGVPWSFVAFLGVLALGLVAMVSIALAPRAQPSVAADSRLPGPQFPGVAIAVPPAVRVPRPVAVPLPPASQTCGCSPGDPLCVCPKAQAPASPWQPIDPQLRSPTKATPFELATSDDPADWQRAREILESKVYNHHGSPVEIRLLKAICKKQGDMTCVDVCKTLEPDPLRSR